MKKSNVQSFQGLTTLLDGQPITNTRKIAQAIKADHKDVIKAVHSLFEDYPELRGECLPPKMPEFEPIIIPYEAEYRGRTFTAYQMNEPAFHLLLPRFRTKRAKQAYYDFVVSFQKMKQQVLQAEANKHDRLFEQLRVDGKQIRKSFTDALKDFIAYAEQQGSSGSKFLYATTSRWINAAIGLAAPTSPSARDSMTLEQSELLAQIEKRAAGVILKGMKLELPYKEIKKDLKEVCMGGVV
ncbi:Rha family transcriptional regulator [Thiomicrorhabdus indica]|uniref:Rha family transcriptional regulator n=1 Tax=Thiomicrorhabdus indica TaxID=2267253 RepID=UPI002AA7A39C|nr:Rha family transcriptional regulator [Thiomicrorhabdus indica]